MPRKNEYVGSVGDRVELQLTVFLVLIFPNKWGYTYLALMRDEEGRTYKTFYQGRKWLPMKWQLIDIKATVAEHENYKGTFTTVLARATVKDLGVAPGHDHCEIAPLPRAEELRLQPQIKAQHAFVTQAKG